MITTTLLLAAVVFPGGWLGLLLKIAIVCVLAWGARELIAWSGWTIPRPIEIVVICLILIVILYWIFELAGMAIG